ncbi:MAG TPA: DNA methyltransferase [Acidimicrobiales bacterium]|nr:DNA methyltransferase [Acidimicrobiales bacterium]
MADELDGLLNRVEDPALRAELRAQIDRLRAKRTFGLVFESHLPERVRLPDHPIRPGALVVGRDEPKGPTYLVLHVRDGVAGLRPVRHPDGSPLTEGEQAEAADRELELAALVVISDFGEPVFPGLRRVGSVERGGDKPAHVVIKGENHHVLEALRFSHAGKVDAIYIDPPYNTGARDWKYDNDYVDDTDAYRHSKWLAFMERRLLLAKELLNPDRSVLIVTIDEKEYLRLGLLLEQTFPGAKVQMVSATISPRSTSRSNEFSRVDEFVYFVFLGEIELGAGQRSGEDAEVRWHYLRRTQRTLVRGSRPRQFFPVYVRPDDMRVVCVGEPMADDEPLDSVPEIKGAVPVFPINSDGEQLIWGLTGPTLEKVLEGGYVRVTRGTQHQPFTISYLSLPDIRRVEEGTYEVRGIRPDGSKIVVIPGGKASRPSTVWRESRHDAGAYGTSLLRALVPGRRFPFPKSLYAVEDTLRFFVADNPDAVVLDFFAGSGTTTHAVARLNRQDGGRRQSIVVTNNEVSAAEADALRKAGHRPGDPEWEALGIFEHITRPRITAAVTGVTPDGEPVKGDYKFTDEFPMAEGFEENVEFAELVYLDPDDVELDLAFASVAPLLWLRAGATGPVIESRCDERGRERPFAWTERYGVLFDTDRWRAFVAERPDTATTAFIVTDSPATFAGVAADLPDSVDVVRLYENYLTTFRVDGGWA